MKWAMSTDPLIDQTLTAARILCAKWMEVRGSYSINAEFAENEPEDAIARVLLKELRRLTAHTQELMETIDANEIILQQHRRELHSAARTMLSLMNEIPEPEPKKAAA